MTAPRFSPGIFLVVFCATYALVFARNLPLFLYYPLHGNFSWGTAMLADAGPAIVWYGLLTNAIVVALIAAVLVPERVAERHLRSYYWLFPCAAMLACVVLLRRFFA